MSQGTILLIMTFPWPWPCPTRTQVVQRGPATIFAEPNGSLTVRGRPFGCPAFDPPPCPKRSESLSARRTCRRCTCQLVDFFLANSPRGKRQPTPPFFLFSEMRGAPYFLFSKNAEKRWRGCRWRARRQNSSNNMTSSTTTTQTTKIICHLQER